MTFNRKLPPRVRSYPTPIPLAQRRNAVFARMDVPAAPPIEKEDAIRSEQYRRLVAACSVDGCEGKHLAKGLCNKHYLRVKTTGTTDVAPKTTKTLREKLSEGSEQSANGCLEWKKSTREGYGRLVFHGKSLSAHVAALELANGTVPPALQVNHKCHNRACINIEHLYVGTQKENMQDMERAGRANYVKGEAAGRAKLTEINVLAIRSSEKGVAYLAREYSVSESLIRSIKKRESWAWLPDQKMAIEKEHPVRSEEYRRLVSSMECAHCGIHGHSQAAHADQGKGAHIKSDDRTCYPACAPRVGHIGCHAQIGMTGSIPREDRRSLEQKYAAQTRAHIEASGQWPKNLPRWTE